MNSQTTRKSRTSHRILVPSLSALALAAVAANSAEARSKSQTQAQTNPEVQATLADIEHTTGGFVPAFLKVLPDDALPGAWAEMKGLWVSDKTALPCKVKEIIGAAVAAQIPNRVQVEGHVTLAKANGATRAEIAEGVTIAAMARKWSTFFNGIQLDEGKFRAEIAHLVQNAKAATAAGGPPPGKPIAVVDARTAQEDMKQSFGFVPEFATKFPAAALPGAWREMRDVEMNPATALPGKYKSLVSLAVASQIPCRYCIIADTEFARLEGATDQEISEAVAMAGLFRHISTTMVGLGVDDASYRKDMERIAQHIMRASTAAPAAGRSGKAAAVATTTPR